MLNNDNMPKLNIDVFEPHIALDIACNITSAILKDYPDVDDAIRGDVDYLLKKHGFKYWNIKYNHVYLFSILVYMGILGVLYFFYRNWITFDKFLVMLPALAIMCFIVMYACKSVFRYKMNKCVKESVSTEITRFIFCVLTSNPVGFAIDRDQERNVCTFKFVLYSIMISMIPPMLSKYIRNDKTMANILTESKHIEKILNHIEYEYVFDTNNVLQYLVDINDPVFDIESYTV